MIAFKDDILMKIHSFLYDLYSDGEKAHTLYVIFS